MLRILKLIPRPGLQALPRGKKTRQKNRDRRKARRSPAAGTGGWGLSWVLRDVVFQDVGFQTTSLKPLTHISFRWEVPTPSVVEGQTTISFKPHILEYCSTTSPNTQEVVARRGPGARPAAAAAACAACHWGAGWTTGRRHTTAPG